MCDTLALSHFFGEKARETPKKARALLFVEPPKILGKEGKNAQKSKGNRKTKTNKEIEKSKGLEGQGIWCDCDRESQITSDLLVLTLQPLLLSISWLFSLSDYFLAFLCVFASFPRIFSVSAQRKTLAFSGVSLAFSPKRKARVGGSGGRRCDSAAV